MIVKAADPEEYTEIYDLVDKAFKQPKSFESKIIKVTTEEDINFQRGDLRVVEVDGRITSVMMVIRRQLRIGEAIVNGAIVAPVATHPNYQRRGFCSAVMRNAVQFMKSQGFDITILWGHPWLYPHYGYSPAMLRTELVITSEQRNSAPPHELRSITKDNVEEITGIYSSNTATRTLAEIRSPKMQEWKLGGHEAELEVVIDKKGKVIGYIAFGTDPIRGRPCAHEIGVLNEEACQIIYNKLLETAKNMGLKEFSCTIHPAHPFSHFSFSRDGELRINRGSGAGMARVLDLTSLLTKMKKEFERRLRHSEFYDLECILRISSDEEIAILEINHGQVSISKGSNKGDHHLIIPLACLNPLITGYMGITDLIKNPRVKVEVDRTLRLIEVLFPADFPFGGHLPLFWE